MEERLARAGLGAHPGVRWVKITGLTPQRCFNGNVSHENARI